MCVCLFVCLFKVVNMPKLQNSEAVSENLYIAKICRRSRQSMSLLLQLVGAHSVLMSVYVWERLKFYLVTKFDFFF